MNRYRIVIYFCLVGLLIFAFGAAAKEPDNPGPPFGFTESRFAATKNGQTADDMALYSPKNPYNIFINYELGMHCVGFDVSYCCIIPPYNSIQAQVVRSGDNSERPRFLSPDDKVRLRYSLKDNTYSEGNKMKYWEVLKDVNGNGSMGDPGDNIANYVWDHLFIYKDLEGTIPADADQSKRLRIGREIPVNIDSGPSGKNIAGGFLDFAKGKGGNIVFTDSLVPQVKNIPLTLTSSYLWDALGLPLTAFNDSTRRGSIRTITDYDFQPYQRAVVQLTDENGRALTSGGRNVEFFGTEPVDISNCSLCHSGEGRAAALSRQKGLLLFQKEYAYWKRNYADISEYMARLSSAMIGILELHDRNFKTAFLKDYNPGAASNRLGNTGSVYCADCHGDNISGNLQSPRPGATGYTALKAKPLTEAVHSVHAGFVPMPDKAGRTQSCQACHPVHWQNKEMNDLKAKRRMNKHQDRIITVLRIVTVVAALFILSACAHVRDASQEKERIVKVSEGIYRGPRLDDLSELQALKVRTILNLEDSSEAVQKESETARNLGITMISIPMSQIFRPRQTDLLRAVKLLEDRRLYPIYVHCLRGRDRTGFVIAAYKILHDGWAAEKAYQEAVENGHNTWFYDAILGWQESLSVIANAKAGVQTIP